MSRRKIKRAPRKLAFSRPTPRSVMSETRNGIEWWRCPTCQTLKVQLVFQKVPPYDVTFHCTQCHQAWKADTGKIIFGTKAELAAEQVRRTQARIREAGK